MSDQTSSRVRQVATVLTAGLVVGAILTFFNVSLIALVFKEELKPFLAQGISLVLSGTVVQVMTTSFLSSMPNAISVPQEVPVGILAVLAVDIAAHLHTASASQVYATVLGAILVSTFFTGLLFWLLGRFQLGARVRSIPFRVIGGFLAGTGWLLLLGALQVMTDVAAGVDLLHPGDMIHWLPGLFMGAVILVVLRRRTHFLLMPGLIGGGIALFYLVATLLGNSPTGHGQWLVARSAVIRAIVGSGGCARRQRQPLAGCLPTSSA
jgi:SulP family sulfate permease